MTIEDFERIAKFAEVDSEAFTLEFINGRLRDKVLPDGDHATIQEWLARRCMTERPGWGLHGRLLGLKVGKNREGRARPDGTLAPAGNFAGQGEWAAPEGVLMTAEITAYDVGSNRRDREERPSVYASTGIPLHLIIDRAARTVTVFSEPDLNLGGYRVECTVKFGRKLVLPAPVAIELDTEELKQYVR
ncbi:Uma2 family endonuclease [Streptomyces sp. NPDC056987]|uniref:Uma2 family endonuclease n=1 Tax=Streptomyces sp. NPDC056987 TaxID=3345988 RepID=UPI0036441837